MPPTGKHQGEGGLYGIRRQAGGLPELAIVRESNTVHKEWHIGWGGSGMPQLFNDRQESHLGHRSGGTSGGWRQVEHSRTGAAQVRLLGVDHVDQRLGASQVVYLGGGMGGGGVNHRVE
eukprot:scaffold29692_cov152-Isochrysis_galbana.AAC.1